MIFGVEIPDPWVGIAFGGLLTWMAYMARQITVQSSTNATTASTLKVVVEDIRELQTDQRDLDRRFIAYVDGAKDKRIKELELELAEARNLG